MFSVSTPQIDIAIPAQEPSFQIDGEIVDILPGCGMATIQANPETQDDFAVNRGTDGVHFEELVIGDRFSCQISISDQRVLYAHQQTLPVGVSASRLKYVGSALPSPLQPVVPIEVHVHKSDLRKRSCQYGRHAIQTWVASTAYGCWTAHYSIEADDHRSFSIGAVVGRFPDIAEAQGAALMEAKNRVDGTRCQS